MAAIQLIAPPPPAAADENPGQAPEDHHHQNDGDNSIDPRGVARPVHSVLGTHTSLVQLGLLLQIEHKGLVCLTAKKGPCNVEDMYFVTTHMF